MKIRITLVIDADPKAYEAEYGDKLTVKEFRDSMKDSIIDTVYNAVYPESSGIIRNVEVK